MTELFNMAASVGGWGMAALFAAVTLNSALYIVPQRKVGLVTRFGKHIRTDENPGLKVKIPFIDRVAAKVSTSEKQVDETLETKTSDDLFVGLPIAIHYEVNNAAVFHFDKGDPVQLMKKVVSAAVREYTSGKTFQELYDERQQIKEGVKEKVEEQINGYGIQINDIVIDEPKASNDVKETFDKVRRSALEKQAATNEAEADYIRRVKAAEADKKRNILIGEGVAGFREKIADSYTELRKKLIADDVDASVADRFMEEAMRLDTLRDIGDKGNMVIVTDGKGNDAKDLTDFISKQQAFGGNSPANGNSQNPVKTPQPGVGQG